MVEHRRSRVAAAPVTLARTAVALLAVFVALAFIAGCSSDSDGSAPTTNASAASTDTGTSGVSGSIIVSAAASLTDAFTTIRDQFVAANPDAHVTLNFGSSGALSTQILNGAPADVAAFADTAPMNALADADLLAAPPKVFARNRLVIVTEPGNPNGIDSLADLATAGTISLCVDTAPCGKFADRILADASVTIPTSNITRGTDVRSTLTAVTDGDAVAGIVYVTDAKTAADRVDTVAIAEADNLTADYPIATLGATTSPALARAFEAYVLSERGRSVLEDAGFLAP